ncbi:energy-coupling factor ABC transporter substrate-binding protein [Halobellus ruber]|uniref:Energy-coupling factor ABC transporter substrate-binding protein n=1 Tax=Halobellus ruber TaxID=2761102 RepID=A0A7J9SMT5_9EURY|nr:energy-coupling factor ABC transporter substrate-binding protein [Halobellus ruber]
MTRAATVGVGLGVAALVAVFAIAGGGAVGTDQQAAAAVAEAAPDYDRWAAPAWAPPAPWGEPLLFALQAGIGGSILAHYLGRLRTDRGPASDT